MSPFIFKKKKFYKNIFVALSVSVGGLTHAAGVADYAPEVPAGGTNPSITTATPTGSVAIGNNARIDNTTPLVSIAIGRDSFVDNRFTTIGTPQALLLNRISGGNPNYIAGGIAMGFNSYATVGSIDIGNKTYKGAMGGLASLTPADTQAPFINMTTVGNNSYNSGMFSTMFGAYNIATSDGINMVTQNFGSTVIGSLNSIRSKESRNPFVGIANSIVGTANIIDKSNGVLIFGAGNKVSNSLSDNQDEVLRALMASVLSIDSPDTLAEALTAATKAIKGGGATLVVGGGNEADYTGLSAMIGVNNTLKGSSSSMALQNFVTGFKNTVYSSSNTTLIGSNNTVSTNGGAEANRNIILGDNHTVTPGTNDAIAIGSVDDATDTSKNTSVSGSVALGHNAVVTASKVADSKGAGVAIGESSVATTQKGVEGYDITAGIDSVAAVDKTSPIWTSTADAVSVGDVANGITRQVTGVAAGTQDTDAVNVAQLKRLSTLLSNQVASITSVEVAGDNKNIQVDPQASATGTTYKVSLKDDIQITNSVDVGGKVNISKNNGINVANTVSITETGVSIKNGPSISTTGINAGGKRITNVADGVKDSDVATVGQLRKSSKDVAKLRQDVERLDKDMRDMRKEMRGLGATAAAAMALPQVIQPGKSMLAASVGTYKGESALAVSWSRASEDGRKIFKAAGSVNSDGGVPVGLGFGYQY